MNTARILELAHQLQVLVPRHEKIGRMARDPGGLLTEAGKKHARACLRHSHHSINNIKAAIVAELEAQ